MLGLSLDSEIPEAFVGVAVAYLKMHVDSDKGCCPAISVSPVLFMHFPDLLNYLLTAMIPDSRFVFQPLIVAGTAHSHQFTEVFYRIVAGQDLDYFELFSFKRTYSICPSEFI